MTFKALEDPALTMPLNRMVTFRVSRLHAKIIAQGTRILMETAGLSLMQWRVLVTLETSGRVTPAEIVRRTGLDKSQLSRTIKGMVADGLLTSEPSETDQRAHVIDVTEKGADLFKRARPHMRRRQQLLLDALSDSELKMLFAAFDKLEHAIEDMEAPA